jgi:hypothetical protein
MGYMICVRANGRTKMPTDYTDPEIHFPRLEAQIFTIDGKVYLLTIWLREKPGKDRRQLMEAKPAGTIDDAHELIQEYAEEYGAVAEPDDITVEM